MQIEANRVASVPTHATRTTLLLLCMLEIACVLPVLSQLALHPDSLPGSPIPLQCNMVAGQCYHNKDGTIVTIPTGITSPAQCCDQCSLNNICVAFTYWIPTNSSVHSCRLYKTRGLAMNCTKEGTIGMLDRPTPPPTTKPPTPAPQPPPKGAKNVLFIAVDDLRAQLGVYGHTDTFTPNLDRFARSALVFDNAHAQIAHCSPSRNSLMSGRTPNRVKVWNFIDDFRDPTVGGLSTLSLPQYFKIHGYRTWGSGKVFHPNKPPNNDQSYSWTDPYDGAASGFCKDFKGGHPSNYLCTGDTDVADGEVSSVTLSKLEELVKSNNTASHGKPFFVASGIHKPHLPYFALPKFANQYPPENETIIPSADVLSVPLGMPPIAWMTCMGLQGEDPNFIDFNNINITIDHPVSQSLIRNLTRGYMISVSYVDDQIGKILDSLEDLKLAEDTVVAIWGDHGQNLGEHNTFCKMTLFESATKVPLLIRDPSSASSSWGQRTSSPAQLLDMYPTLVALAGLPSPGNGSLDGVDLSPLFVDPSRTDVSIAAYSQQAKCYRVNQPVVIPTPEEATLKNMMTCSFVERSEMNFMGYSVRTREYRYNEWVAWNGTTMTPIWEKNVGVELYDHRTPAEHPEWSENVNIAADPLNKPVVSQLSTLLRAHFSKA